MNLLKTININQFKLIVLITLFSCSQSNPKDSSKHTICQHSVQFGDMAVCLPLIDGMEECYSNPKAKAYIDQFVDNGSVQLALYLNNSTYKQIDKLNEISFDDYLSLIGTKPLKDISISKSKFDKIANAMEGMYNKEIWDNVKSKIEKNFDYVTIGKPIIVESYTLNSNIRTFVILTKWMVQNSERVSLMLTNLIRIKDRVLIMTYYKDYSGEKSFTEAKSKNDYLVLLFTDENK